jgi:hypothetical protein
MDALFGRYDSIEAVRRRRETQKKRPDRSQSPQSEGEPHVQKIDVPEIGPFARQVLRKQVGPDEARLEEFDRMETRYQDAVNRLANARSPEEAERAREVLRRNPPLTVKQQDEKIRLEKRVQAVGRNPGLFPQIDKPLPVLGVGRRKRSKTKKRAVRRTRRGKVRVYS